MTGDWRLNGQEGYLQSARLIRVRFPEYWEKAREQKNGFYEKVAGNARQYVEKGHAPESYLAEDKLQALWHDHCVFCWHKAETHLEETFYCTQDHYHWICEDCFRDFRERFQWTLTEE